MNPIRKVSLNILKRKSPDQPPDQPPDASSDASSLLHYNILPLVHVILEYLEFRH